MQVTFAYTTYVCTKTQHTQMVDKTGKQQLDIYRNHGTGINVKEYNELIIPNLWAKFWKTFTKEVGAEKAKHASQSQLCKYSFSSSFWSQCGHLLGLQGQKILLVRKTLGWEQVSQKDGMCILHSKLKIGDLYITLLQEIPKHGTWIWPEIWTL